MSLQFLADFSSESAHDAPVWTVATSSKVVWSGSADGQIKAWDSHSGRPLRRIHSPHRNAVTSLALSERQGILISGSIDGSIALWTIDPFHRSQEELPKIDGIIGVQPPPSQDVADGDDAAVKGSVGNGQSMGATSTEDNGNEIEPLVYVSSVSRVPFTGESPPFPIDAYSSDLSPMEPIIAVTGNTAAISLYTVSWDGDSEETPPLTPLRRFRANNVIRPRTVSSAPSPAELMRGSGASARKGWGTCVRFTPDGSMVAVGVDSGQVIIHDVETGSVVASFSNHSAPIRSVEFSLSQTIKGQLDHLFIASEDRSCSVHDATHLDVNGPELSDQTVSLLQGHNKMVLAAQAREDGRIVATISTDKSVRLWDLLTSPTACVCNITEDAAIWSLKWISNNRFVVAGDSGLVRWYRGAGAATTAGDEL